MNKIIGSTIERIDSVGSSNNYAASQLLTKRLTEGIVFVAGSQLDGRGQGSNRWESEPNRNLTFSILLYPDFIPIARQFEISKAISLGVTDFLKPLVDQVSIKWPNDIYVGHGKVAGILIENSIRTDRISSCIVGIGLNINQSVFISDAPNPVSLLQITGKVYDTDRMLSELCVHLDHRYHQLRNGTLRGIDQDYSQMMYQRDCWSPYSDENGEFEGRILGVDEIGRLLIETLNGTIKTYHFKEVVFR